MCGSCGNSVQNSPSYSLKTTSSEPCDYTKEQVENWRNKIICIDSGNQYVKAGINRTVKNKYLGVVNTIVLYNNNPCFFKKELDQIYDLVIKIIDLGICQ